MTTLPHFTYHPDPVGTGSITASAETCRCCGQARGFIYTGPVYAAAELENALCPWCIADGSAAARFEAEFTAPGGVASGLWIPVPDEVTDEVCYRTPGFTGWQDTRWWTHCRDAGEFLGHGGHEDLAGRWAGAVAEIREDLLVEDEEWEDILASLGEEGDGWAYVFRCRHCGTLGGYADWS